LTAAFDVLFNGYILPYSELYASYEQMVERELMTSKRTIAERNLTTIQLSKETVQLLRQAESYPRETYDCIMVRLLELHSALTAKLKVLEAYPHEPIQSIITTLIEEHNSRTPKKQQAKPTKGNEETNHKPDAAEAFQKEFSKITGQ
jgi:hypothetical protein